MVENGSLDRLLPLVNYINSDPLSDHSKSKAQTTKVQQPRPCLQIPFAEIHCLAEKEKEKEKKNISFSSLPDGKSASRKNWSTKCFAVFNVAKALIVRRKHTLQFSCGYADD